VSRLGELGRPTKTQNPAALNWERLDFIQGSAAFSGSALSPRAHGNREGDLCKISSITERGAIRDWGRGGMECGSLLPLFSKPACWLGANACARLLWYLTRSPQQAAEVKAAAGCTQSKGSRRERTAIAWRSLQNQSNQQRAAMTKQPYRFPPSFPLSNSFRFADGSST
jgi:hypothetical protein